MHAQLSTLTCRVSSSVETAGLVAAPLKAGASAKGALPHAGAAVLLRRGNCTFFQKAVNLQQAGAAVGLVANTDGGTGFGACKHDSNFGSYCKLHEA